VILEQIAVVDARDAGLGVDVEWADPLVLRGDALACDQSLPIPFEMALSAHDRPFDKGSGEGDQIGYELVEGISPAALSELVLDLDFHPIDAVLRRLQNLEPELLRHDLLELGEV